MLYEYHAICLSCLQCSSRPVDNQSHIKRRSQIEAHSNKAIYISCSQRKKRHEPLGPLLFPWQIKEFKYGNNMIIHSIGQQENRNFCLISANCDHNIGSRSYPVLIIYLRCVLAGHEAKFTVDTDLIFRQHQAEIKKI
jgi:hypothetical protein